MSRSITLLSNFLVIILNQKILNQTNSQPSTQKYYIYKSITEVYGKLADYVVLSIRLLKTYFLSKEKKTSVSTYMYKINYIVLLLVLQMTVVGIFGLQCFLVEYFIVNTRFFCLFRYSNTAYLTPRFYCASFANSRKQPL